MKLMLYCLSFLLIIQQTLEVGAKPRKSGTSTFVRVPLGLCFVLILGTILARPGHAVKLSISFRLSGLG
jgi:hypothetical protein